MPALNTGKSSKGLKGIRVAHAHPDGLGVSPVRAGIGLPALETDQMFPHEHEAGSGI